MNIQKTATINELIVAITSNEEVSIVGFGKFSVNSLPERQVRNPATGAMITAKASKKLKFKASATLNDSL